MSIDTQEQALAEARKSMSQREALTEGVNRGWHCPWAECVPVRDDDWRSGKLYRVGSQYTLHGQSSESYVAAFADADKRAFQPAKEK